MTTKSDYILEASSAEAYTLRVDSTTDGRRTYDMLHARRVRDCAR